GFRTPGGGDTRLPGDGILVGAALAHTLGVGVGDTVTITPAFGAAHTERLAGLVEEPLGTFVYATDATATAIGGVGATGYLLRFNHDADADALRARLTALPGVLSYADTHALEHEVDKFLGLFWVFVVVMLVLGAALSFTVIYVTMTVNVAERTTELATLRAVGVPVRRITAALAAENLTATTVALPFGLAAGVATAWAFLRSFGSDMFSMTLSIGVLPLALAAAAVLCAAALSQLPSARLLRRIDVARVVRERAQ
ncbi:ABC transporter permease, partial [Nocardia gipuzkoensis]